ncbi:uncharacterized protein [Rutidosis leptorrhynchoides]|uniref:uncharacterized protein n=1 Tax=Rutidosis leptorrhynchoides TaxID=125765 RepID=UPI003A98E2D4
MTTNRRYLVFDYDEGGSMVLEGLYIIGSINLCYDVHTEPTNSSSSSGNCNVVVEASKYTADTNPNTLQISLSRNAKITISVVDDNAKPNDYSPDNVGQVDTKGKARRLPVKADIRKALCFSGGSTLMVAHLQNECADNYAESLKLISSVLKLIQKLSTVPMVHRQCSGDDKLLNNNQTFDGCQEHLVCLDNVECMNTEKSDDNKCSCSSGGCKEENLGSLKHLTKVKKKKSKEVI